MSDKKPSRNAVDGKIHVIRKGLAVYKVNASPYYRVRIWVPSEERYLVKSTKTLSKISAIGIPLQLLRAPTLIELLTPSWQRRFFATSGRFTSLDGYHNMKC